jgi:hypothetical protein
MHNIKIIFTHHSELGKNSASALCEVIHSISPNVIFEEWSEQNHARVYKIRESIAVETDAIKMYLQHNDIDQVPVDTYELDETDIKDQKELHTKVCSLVDIKEAVERNDIIKQHRELIIQHGLTFINSDENERMFKLEQALLRKIVELSNDDRLRQLEYECDALNIKREYEIINNIYRYSESNQYERAIMFIGSGHRSSILKVIEQFELKEKLKLNWLFYAST